MRQNAISSPQSRSRRRNRFTAAFAGLIFALQFVTLAAGAQTAPNFDLQSTDRNLTNQSGPGAINVAGNARMVGAGDALTAAEQVALSQVLASGRQSVILNAQGAAVGGSVNLGTDLAGTLSGLTIPSGVTALRNFGQSPSFDVLGNLVNAGKLFAFSAGGGNATATISATNIQNLQGALISSIVPSHLLPANSLASLNLNLHALNDIVNNGTISSSGALCLLAGGTITNATSQGGMAAVVQAAHGVDVTAANVVNSGLISALAGNINVQSLTGSLIVNNHSGVMEAVHGDISFSVLPSFVDSLVSVNGGNFHSQNLTLSALHGWVKGEVGIVDGWINIDACNAAFGANTPHLKFGALNITGDPTFYNTAGSLSLANISNTNGANLALIAAGDITVTGGTIETTMNGGGDGGDLIIMAGANFTSSNGPGQVLDNTTHTLTISDSAETGNGSLTGGAINLSGVTSINTNGTLDLNESGFDGGNVFMVAFAGAGVNSGTINLGSNGSINAFGGGGGVNGNVTIIAGATADPVGVAAINIPAIFSGVSATNSQSGVGGGTIDVRGATPTFAGNVTILNGGFQTGAGNITASASLQPTSIAIGAVGGTNIVVQSLSVTNWQTAATTYALAEINASRATESLPALTLSPSLTQVAEQYAEYMAQTGHFNHFSLNGANPAQRAVAHGVPNGIAYAENVAMQFGTPGFVTAQTTFDNNHAAMMAEPVGQPNHRANIMDPDFQFVGIGFANSGGAYYYVENYTEVDPTPPVPVNPSVPLHGGVHGGAGLLAVSTTNNTINIIGSSSTIPVSAVSGGANITIRSGADIDVIGSLIANGASSTIGAFGGANGGSVNISAAQDITISGMVQSSGGRGGDVAFSFGSTVGGAGGTGGTVTILSQLGNISIIPSAPCAECLAIATSGGTGGQSTRPVAGTGGDGGAGGSGGAINVSAPGGSITLTALDSGGGGGSGGAGGATAGTGGNGGHGGNINLAALNSITVEGYANASGGGGGGGGGTGANAGGGGGGGALAMPGQGGSSASFTSGGGGGALGLMPGYGGPQAGNVLTSNSSAGAGVGLGGAAGVFGGGGGAGTGVSGTNGGAGGAMGANGVNGSGGATGGLGGNGGDIQITAKTIAVESDAGTFWAPRTVSQAASSLMAAGTDGSVMITSTGGAVAIYDPNMDLTSTNRNIVLEMGANFEVGSLTSGNGTFGSIIAGPEPNSITINTIQNNSPLTTGSFNSGGGSGSVTITLQVIGDVTYSDNDLVTPAELIAIIQKDVTGLQPMTLDQNGAAASGAAFTIASGNIPSPLGFTTLILPAGVTAEVTANDLSYTTNATIDGTMTFNNGSGPATFSTPSLILNGSLTDTVGDLTIQQVGGSLNVALGAAGTLAATSGNLAFNGLSSGPISITTGNGTISASGGAGTINFNGGTGGVNVSVNALLGTVLANGTPINITTATGSMTTGAITSTGNVTLDSNGDITVNGPLATTGNVTFNPAASGDVTGTGSASGNLLTINTISGDINLTTDVTAFAANTTGDITLNEANSIDLAGVSADDLTVTTGAGSTISTSGNVTAAGTLTFQTNNVANNNAITGNMISISNNPGNPGLNLSGIGTYTSTIGPNITATSGNLTFSPNTQVTFNGPANLTANGVGQFISLNSGVILTGNNAYNMNTSIFQLNGGTLAGTAPTMNSAIGRGTISNTAGDVVLPTGFTFVGSDLAILASRDVRSTGGTSINLSNTKGNGGSLTIVAGFDFSGPAGDSTFKTATPGTYVLGNTPSSTGGSVHLPKMAINTSSGFATGKAGNVTIVAHAGNSSAGTVAVGAINASGSKTAGTGGTVNIIGQGGILSGAINTSGATGGAVNLRAAEPAVVGGSISLNNGVLTGPGSFAAQPTNLANGGGIWVKGAITTAGAKQFAGDVTAVADSQIEIGSIVATGFNNAGLVVAGGDVNIDSATSKVIIGSSGINTSGLNSTLPAARAADAGSITIAGEFVQTGKLIAKGGNNMGAGGGGHGGDVNVSTNQIIVNGNPMFAGGVKIIGAVDTRGGDASKTLGGNGGDGGNAGLIGGTVVVTGAISSGSVITSGGIAGNPLNVGAPGTILIETYGLQALPSNLDLLSNKPSIPVLPGAMFTVGLSSPINGVAGKLISGTANLSKTNTTGGIGNVFDTVPAGNDLTATGITVNVTGAALSLTQGGVGAVKPLVDAANKRTLATPGQALALYQVSRDNLITHITLDAMGVTTGGSVNIDQSDLSYTTFTAFKTPATMDINFVGTRPVVTLPGTTSIAGTLNFITPNSTGYLNLGSGNLVLPVTGEITGTNTTTLILSGTGGTWTNNGLIEARDIVLARPSSAAMTFVTGATGRTRGAAGAVNPSILLAPSIDVGAGFTFKATGATEFSLPIEFGTVLVPTIYKANAVGNAANASVLRAVSITSAMTDAGGLQITPSIGGTLNAASITIKGINGTFNKLPVTTSVLVRNDANFTASKTINISATNTVTLGNNINMTTGVMKSVGPTWDSATLVKTSDMASNGSINITAAGNNVIIGNNNTLINTGSKLTIQATKGDVQMGTGNTFRDMGGNIHVFAFDDVSGATGNTFQAKGTLGSANGGIEFTSGFVGSVLSFAFGRPGGTVPPVAALGTNVTINNPDGVVFLNQSTGVGTIDLSNSTFNTDHGASIFSLKGAGASIDIDGATFETKSSKPIAFVSPAFQAGKDMLVDATETQTIDTPHGTITLKKGSIVHLENRDAMLFVRACGHGVSLFAHGKAFALHPGQEVAFSRNSPTHLAMNPADGIGRRNQTIEKLADGTYVVYSDFAIVSLAASLPKQPRTIKRMLKTAAAVEMVTRTRGAYHATPRKAPKHGSPNIDRLASST